MVATSSRALDGPRRAASAASRPRSSGRSRDSKRVKSKDSADRTEGAQAVGRAMEVLRAVTRCQSNNATLSTIMAATQLSRSTAFRLLRYLTEERMLEFDSQRRSYHVGPLAFELGLAARGPANLAAEWKDRLAKIAKRTDSTAYLVARANTDVVCLATEHAQSVVRAVSLVVGQRLPLGVGAGSLAILSLLPDVEVNSTIVANESRLRMYGDGRLTPRVLRQRIESTRANGFAFSQDSVASGVIGIGITIPLRAELTQLAVSVSRAAKSMDVAERARLADLIRGIAKT